jgi:hypothetical protein
MANLCAGFIANSHCLTHGNTNEGNTGFGYLALRSTNAGQTANTAFGCAALSNTGLSFRYNTGIGSIAGCNNTSGQQNTAFGAFANRAVTTPYQNTAFGFKALCAHSTGCKQIGLGACAMYDSTTASKSTGIGFRARTANTACSIAIGAYACSGGNRSVAIGAGAVTNGDNAVAIGRNSDATTDSVALGYGAKAYGSQDITIGSNAISNGACQITIAPGFTNAYPDGTIVMGSTFNNVCNKIYTNWTYCSDGNEKSNVETLSYNFGLPLIKKLRPVKFNWDVRERYVKECGFEFGVKDGTLSQEKEQYGLVAQELEQTLNELNLRFDSLKTNSKRYRLANTDLIAPLVKSIQQLSAKLDTIKERITTLETA